MPWKPSEPGEIPTLGWYVLDWIAENLARPAVGEYEPFRPYLEQEDFILRWYALDPKTGRFLYPRAVLGRSRGWGKSPVLGSLCIVEGLADVVFDGWDSAGQPVGRPWSTVRTPLVHVAAVNEDQTGNTWQPLVEMLQGPVQYNYAGLEPFDAQINLPVGKIEKRTSSGRAIKGAPTTFAVLDQTEEWVPSNKGPRLAQTIRTNTAKNGGRTVESPNAFTPGENSVAEDSWKFSQGMKSGKDKLGRRGILYDHREAPADTDLSDYDSLVHGLRIAYGDSSGHPDGCLLHTPPCPPGHVDLDAQIDVIWDPATDIQRARSDYLNQITHASDSYLTRPEWNARSIQTLADADTPVKVEPLTKGDVIVLGFDGSIGRKNDVTTEAEVEGTDRMAGVQKRGRGRAVSDATALIACRVSDGLVTPIHIWEQPPGVDEWAVPQDEVDAKVRETFDAYKVVGFYADPAKWEGWVAKWEARYGVRLRVKATRSNPIHWWMNNTRNVTQALEQFRTAIQTGELVHDGNSILTAHALNARVREKPGGYGIYKEHPDSANKIDAVVAAVLAWQCRLDAVAAGHAQPTTPVRAPRRIR